MRFIITGEKGFIATNLIQLLRDRGHYVHNTRLSHRIDTGESCVHRNNWHDWCAIMSTQNIDMVIHNAAVVGTDVVALDPVNAELTNLLGTKNIIEAANKVQYCRSIRPIPVCYIGTSVIYDALMYQSTKITEISHKSPKTLYGKQKLAAEILMQDAELGMIIRPLFAYGGVGDMNSLISKCFYRSLTSTDPVDMFLDPEKTKDYMHVDDFCRAVITACEMKLWSKRNHTIAEFNVSAETPHTTRDIVDMMTEISGRDIASLVKWHPSTDYLGNHLLSSQKFRQITGWLPQIDIRTGLDMSWRDISENLGAYDPMKYLDRAKNLGIDLIKHY